MKRLLTTSLIAGLGYVVTKQAAKKIDQQGYVNNLMIDVKGNGAYKTFRRAFFNVIDKL